MKIGRYARFQVLSFTYIDDSVGIVIELVAARFIRQPPYNTSQIFKPFLVLFLCHVSRETLNCQKRCQIDIFELITTMQPFVCNLNDEVHIYLLWMKVLYQLVSSFGCTSCC